MNTAKVQERLETKRIRIIKIILVPEIIWNSLGDLEFVGKDDIDSDQERESEQ